MKLISPNVCVLDGFIMCKVIETIQRIVVRLIVINKVINANSGRKGEQKKKIKMKTRINVAKRFHVRHPISPISSLGSRCLPTEVTIFTCCWSQATSSIIRLLIFCTAAFQRPNIFYWPIGHAIFIRSTQSLKGAV